MGAFLSFLSKLWQPAPQQQYHTDDQIRSRSVQESIDPPPQISAVNTFTPEVTQTNQNQGHSSTPKASFDFLVFAQRWPPSACYKLQKRGCVPCRLPENHEWTIHGLWPMLSGSKQIAFCEHSNDLHYNPDILIPFLGRMKQTWTAVDASKTHDSFWQYEWEKHGTCGVGLEALNTLEKYCQKSMELQEQYNMKKILDRAGIFPGGSYSIETITEGLAVTLRKRCVVQCMFNHGTRNWYLLEIRVWLDKSFNLIDPIGIPRRPAFCPSMDNILYPLSSPSGALVQDRLYLFC